GVVAPTLPLLRVRVLAPRLAERTALAVEEEDVDRETVGELHAAETAGDLDRVRPVVAPEEGADHRARAAVADRCRELDPARPPGGGRRRSGQELVPGQRRVGPGTTAEHVADLRRAGARAAPATTSHAEAVADGPPARRA